MAVKQTKQLEMEVEQTQMDIAEASGSQGAIRKRPVTMPITAYFSKSDPVKYKLDSDFQRRADIELASNIVTSNLSFKHIESDSFHR